MEPYSIIFAIIFVFGILGGHINFLKIPKEEKTTNKRALHLFTGLIASFSVPLFLNITSSSILSDALSNSDTSNISYFVFAGFCGIAAYFSDRFIQSLSDKILDKLEKIDGDIEITRAEFQEAKAQLNSIKATQEHNQVSKK